MASDEDFKKTAALQRFRFSYVSNSLMCDSYD
jgi:hypothetical protein